jgi:hypothetical protein
MAINTGLIKIKGTIGGMTFYDYEGENRVKLANGPDRDRIMRDPAFKRTRENMTEFGGAATAGKAFRKAFNEAAKQTGDRYFGARVLGLLRRINILCPGIRGKRTFDFASFPEYLKDLEFNKKVSLGSVFFAPYEKPSFNANRDVVTLNIPEFDTDVYINAPKGSTHFRLMLASGVLSNYVFDDGIEKYVPTDSDYEGMKASAFSNTLPLGGSTAGAVTLSTDFGVGAALPASVVVPAAIGIVFYQEIKGQLYVLESHNAMRIDAVG